MCSVISVYNYMLHLYVNVSFVLVEEPDCKSEEKMLLLKDLVSISSE